MLIKAKLVRRFCSIDDHIHVFLNFIFENDLSQLAIENPMVSSDLYATHKVEKTSLPNCINHSRACLGLEQVCQTGGSRAKCSPRKDFRNIYSNVS